MIQFTKLRLQGFKSFVEPCDFDIQEGLTAIVGPNGCGKSNIVEALRWCMGETSAKRLRGAEMADVIFSGTTKRPRRNIAEVQVLLDNRSREVSTLWGNFDELLVSRKIDRDKGSTYRINGREVRARDVQLLFADSASGAGSTSLVGQGKINQIITAKPQERRILLEEAANVAGLRSRRHECELRLRNTRVNLERLDDLIAEMSKRYRELSKQSKQARVYRQLNKDIEETELKIAALDWLAVSEELQDLNQSYNAAQSAHAKSSVAFNALQRKVDATEDELEPLRKVEAEARLQYQQLRNNLDKALSEKERYEAEQENISSLLEQLESDQKSRMAEKTRISENMRTLARKKTDLGKKQPQIFTQLEEIVAEIDVKSVKLRTLEGSLQQKRQEFAAHEATQNQIKRTLDSAELAVKRAFEDLKTQQKALNDAETKREAASNGQSLAQLDQALDRVAECLNTQEQALQEALKEQEVLSLEKQHRAAALQQAQRRLQDLEQEKSRLERLLANHYKGKAVSEALHAPAFLAQALAAALSADAKLPLNKGGHGWQILSPQEPDLPQSFEPLAAKVTKIPKPLERRLQNTALVSCLEEALAVQENLKPGQNLVTKTGWLITWDGLVKDPSTGDASLAERLERQERLTKLDFELEEAKTHLKAAQRDQQDIEVTFNTFNQNLHKLRNERVMQEQAQKELRRKRDTLRTVLEEQLAKIAQLEGKIEIAKQNVAQSNARHASARAELGALSDLQQLKTEIGQETQNCEQDRHILSRLRRKRAELEEQKIEIQHQLIAMQSETRLQQDYAKTCDQQLSDFLVRKTDMLGKRQTLVTQSHANDQRIQKASRALEESDEKCERVKRELSDAQAELFELNRMLTKAQNEAQNSKEILVRTETRLENGRASVTQLRERLRDTFNQEPQGILTKARLESNKADVAKRETFKTKLEDQKRRRDKMGIVNLLADQENEALEQDLLKLKTERSEIITAVDKLEIEIRRLNGQAREKLREAFTRIDQNFARLFEQLFGGGIAQLKLVDSEDPLQAGLEILASPPGKKMQLLSLLSGGEQTMAAIALLFSVFLVNPAPICVLDEADAPLDENNVLRLCALIRELAKSTKTRFILVTHNPVTMARVDRLYGVTMQEQGVSTLLSLDLKGAEQLAEVV